MKGKEFITYDEKKLKDDMEAYQFTEDQVWWINYARLSRNDLTTIEDLINWLIVREHWKKDWRKEKPDS